MSTPGDRSRQPPIPGSASPPAPPSYPGVPTYPGVPSATAPPTGYPQPGYLPPSYPQQAPGYPSVPQSTVPQSAVPQSVAPVSVVPNSVRPVPVSVNQPVPVSKVVPGYQPVPIPVQPAVPVAPRPLAAGGATFDSPVVPRPVPISAAAATTAAARPIPAPAPVANRPIAARPIPARPIPMNAQPAGPVVAARDEDDEPPKEIITPKSMSPWLVSTIVHFLAVIVLAFIIFKPKDKDPVALEMVYAEAIGEQLQTDKLDTGFEDPETTDASLAIDIKAMEDPLAAPPQLIEFSPNVVGLTSNMEAPSIGLALKGREAGSKKALLSAYGGTATTEESVKMGLEWLQRHQRPDGTWSLEGPYSNPSLSDNVTSATAMALLAFQGAGNTPTTGEFKKTVDKGWKALLAMQDRDGNFVRDAGFNQRLYAQAQATIAICELYGMTKESRYAGPAELAVQFAIKSQAPEGGWRYQPGIDADTSVTGWFVMALQSARMAGLEVPQSSLDNIGRFLDSVATDDKVRYRYRPGEKGETSVMTAEAMLCRQYLGWKREDERMGLAADYVIAHPLDYSQQNVYYWYYATQFLHHYEGTHWNKWNGVMRQALPTQQVKTGAEKGSWSPTNDEWGSAGGRLYVTCLSIYMLEVYYRHLPLYSGAAFH